MKPKRSTCANQTNKRQAEASLPPIAVRRSTLVWLVSGLFCYLPFVVYTFWRQSSQVTRTVSVAEESVGVKKTDTKPNTPNTSFDTSIPSRVWETSRSGFPCYSGQKRLMIQEPAHDGFLFQRPMKVGSTTMVSVVLRLAHNRSPWLNRDNTTNDSLPINQQLKCVHRSMHGDALGLEYDKRDRSKSFLFSLLRHPTKRAISQFFHFDVSFYTVQPTDAAFLEFLRRPYLEHNYLYDLMVTNYTKNLSAVTRAFLRRHDFSNETELKKAMEWSKPLTRAYNRRMKIGKTHLTKVVQDILDGYDFIAITERMDESLVAMQMLLNLTTKDILYTRARSSASFSNGPKKNPCIYIQPSFLTPTIKDYLESPEWQHMIRGDLLLYKAANASLDRTIEALGKDKFQQNFRAFQAGMKLAENHCKGRVQSTCSEGGDYIPPENRTCYIWGEACDHECLNDLVLS